MGEPAAQGAQTGGGQNALQFTVRISIKNQCLGMGAKLLDASAFPELIQQNFCCIGRGIGQVSQKQDSTGIDGLVFTKMDNQKNPSKPLQLLQNGTIYYTTKPHFFKAVSTY